MYWILELAIAIVGAQNDLFVFPMDAVLAGRVGLDSFGCPRARERGASAIILALFFSSQNESCFLTSAAASSAKEMSGPSKLAWPLAIGLVKPWQPGFEWRWSPVGSLRYR